MSLNWIYFIRFIFTKIQNRFVLYVGYYFQVLICCSFFGNTYQTAVCPKKKTIRPTQVSNLRSLFDSFWLRVCADFFRYDEILDWIIKCILVVHPAVLLSQGAMQGTNIQSKCKFTTPRIAYLYLNISFGVANWNVVI